MDQEVWIVLGSNSYHQVSAYGTYTGKPFRSEDAANRQRRKLEKRYRHLDFLALPLQESPREDEE